MKSEVKVGLLFIASVVSVLAFAYWLGLVSPWSQTKSLKVMYNFAGGIEVGSPVRVMGIKVGRVKSIDFLPENKMPNGEEVKLQVVIEIENKAWTSIRSDSQFFINLAGVIGEKFLEISPGSVEASILEPNSMVRGEDPPRIDQLISQSYGLAGKLIEVLDKNKGNVSSLIAELDKLLLNFNKTLALLDKVSRNKDVSKVVANTIQITDDLAYLTKKMRSQKAEDTYALVHKLLFRLENLDGPAIRKFLQEEGIKAKLF